jgi:hypothetical protein
VKRCVLDLTVMHWLEFYFSRTNWSKVPHQALTLLKGIFCGAGGLCGLHNETSQVLGIGPRRTTMAIATSVQATSINDDDYDNEGVANDNGALT